MPAIRCAAVVLGPDKEEGATTTRQPLFVDDEGHPLTYSSYSIRVVDGPDSGASLEGERPLIRVGSAPDNDLVLNDPAVSRHHLELQRQQGKFLVVDLGSTNGTYVGALQVREATLHGVADIRVGKNLLRFEPQDHREVVHPSASMRCGEMFGRSQPMREVFGFIERIARTDLPVLITGETGTGKELASRAVHQLSKRSSKPFVTLDCGALPPTLIESALFGFERGAFTGADRSYAGVFERANGGTLFLDEIGELPIDLQPKLLRAVERGEVERLRGDKAVRVDVRVLAATNRPLESMITAGTFRADLYYRLAVVKLPLPALRHRAGDLPLLVEHILERSKSESQVRGIDSRALEILSRYDFPGNVRELVNILRRTAALARGTIISAADLPPELATSGTPSGGDSRTVDEDAGDSSEETRAPKQKGASLEIPAGLNFKDAKQYLLDSFEREYLENLLERHRFNVSSAAREAGIGRRHLHRLLDKYNVATRGTR